MATKKIKPASTLRAKAVEVQGKFKDVAGKAGALVKENAQVALASGKVLTGGLKLIGTTNVADSRKAVAVLSADFKALAKVKTLPEMLRLQREQTARSIKAVTAAGKRNVSELTELAGKVTPMIKGRFKANLELLRKAA